jgi:predicted membrane channel-forming protein YqfA (hemolysin III family)
VRFSLLTACVKRDWRPTVRELVLVVGLLALLLAAQIMFALGVLAGRFLALGVLP